MSQGSVLISDRAFWRPGRETTARQRELLGYLVERGPVDVIYTGPDVAEFERLAAHLAATRATTGIRCESLPPGLDPRRAAARLAAVVQERWPARVLVMSPDLVWVPEVIPAEIPVVLDLPGPLDAADAGRLFGVARAFDLALFDDEGAFAHAAAALGRGRCGFTPQPVVPVDPLPPVRGTVGRIGVYFGAARVDAAAIAWLRRVWLRPELAAARDGVEVVVGGDVGDGAVRRDCPEFRFVGPVDRAWPFFAAVDVVAAPPGAPPPTEALGFARPVVAMLEAVRPLHSILSPVCILGADEAGFAEILALIVGDTAARRRLVDAGLAAARRDLAPETCFRPLVDAVAGVRPAAAQTAERDGAAPLPLPVAMAQGMAHQRAGRLALAEATFRAILARDPDHAEALFALGFALSRRGDSAAALPLLQRATELRAAHAPAWNALATVLNALSRHGEAEAAADHALALRGGLVGALANRARARRGLGRFGEAVADCSAALAVTRDSPELLHERGLARAGQGDFASAESDLRAALAQRPHLQAWAADLRRLREGRDAARECLPVVALACGCGGLPAAWESVWALPGIAISAVSPDDGSPPECDLLITDAPDFAARAAAAGRTVWLCGAAAPDSAGIKTFSDAAERGWAIADVSAHLAVWARTWAARTSPTKPIAATVPEGYIPQ